jgi:hypothetical protein
MRHRSHASLLPPAAATTVHAVCLGTLRAVAQTQAHRHRHTLSPKRSALLFRSSARLLHGSCTTPARCCCCCCCTTTHDEPESPRSENPRQPERPRESPAALLDLMPMLFPIMLACFPGPLAASAHVWACSPPLPERTAGMLAGWLAHVTRCPTCARLLVPYSAHRLSSRRLSRYHAAPCHRLPKPIPSSLPNSTISMPYRTTIHYSSPSPPHVSVSVRPPSLMRRTWPLAATARVSGLRTRSPAHGSGASRAPTSLRSLPRTSQPRAPFCALPSRTALSALARLRCVGWRWLERTDSVSRAGGAEGEGQA